MNRPNLLSLAATAVLLSIASSEALAQYPPQYGPPQYGGAPEYAQQPYQRHPSLIQMPQNHYQPPTVDHYVESAPPLWDQNRPIEHFLHEVASRSWVRIEFMQWSMREPGGGTIGAPVAELQNVLPNTSVEGITSPVEVNNNLNGGNTAGFVLVSAVEWSGPERRTGNAWYSWRCHERRRSGTELLWLSAEERRAVVGRYRRGSSNPARL
jgi:hypothetical protein